MGFQHLFEILNEHFTVKNSENVVKSRYFEKPLEWKNEEGMWGIVCKNTNFLLT